MNLLEIIKNRRSVRSWTKEEIPEEVVTSLIDAARWSPSSGNRQACRFLVVRNEEKRKVLCKLRERFCFNAPLLILVGVDIRVYDEAEKSYVPYMDVSAAIENMLLMAHYLSLGACWMKLGPAELANRQQDFEKAKSILKIPSYFLPVTIVSIGYPKKIPKAPDRKNIEDIVYYETFEGKM